MKHVTKIYDGAAPFPAFTKRKCKFLQDFEFPFNFKRSDVRTGNEKRCPGKSPSKGVMSPPSSRNSHAAYRWCCPLSGMENINLLTRCARIETAGEDNSGPKTLQNTRKNGGVESLQEVGRAGKHYQV